MEFEIEYNGKKEQVVLKDDIPFGETGEISKQVYETKINEITGEMTSNFNRSLFNELRVLKYIEKAPFEINLESIRKLPTKTALKLLNKIEEISGLNVITEDDIKK